MKIVVSAVLAAGVALAVAGTSYAALDAAAVIKTRQDGMKGQGGALKGLGQGLGSGASAADLKVFSAKLVASSAQVGGWFPKGSGPESGVKTHAKSEIWSDAAGFATARTNFATQAGKLDAAVASGDMDAIKAQFGATRLACKACHDKYKAED
ncbi:cytochrome c556 [Caulobacter ginsengisoli]|uniref:Cytochrome c556 n=1 Tax=Caulobacter ginsengisoli TaxID=400775 RepID=A0ABU0IQF5_9CAUL|nr:cytochrome c [Caulobacter ginsengisoli]MDQ0464247.1 cytochrome c556 [Caulobacter ginsengisoli]